MSALNAVIFFFQTTFIDLKSDISAVDAAMVLKRLVGMHPVALQDHATIADKHKRVAVLRELSRTFPARAVLHDVMLAVSVVSEQHQPLAVASLNVFR